jgi:hypothetical protein
MIFATGLPMIEDTGGGCKVLEIPVLLNESLRLITISDDVIVGRWSTTADYFEDTDVLWTASNWKELAFTIGIKEAIQVRAAFNEYWPYDEYMEHRQWIDKLMVVQQFATAWSMLSANWDNEMFDDGYPLPVDFDELGTDVWQWYENVMDKAGRNLK